MTLDIENNEIYAENPGTLSIRLTHGDLNVTLDEGSLNAMVKQGGVSIIAKQAIELYAEGNLNARIKKSVNIESTTGIITLKSKSRIFLDGGTGDTSGVVTGATICAMTGKPHKGASMNVFASNGGT
jgi:uncharacterized protein (DUF2345 family)